MAYNNRHEANVLNEDMVAAFLKDMVARVESSSDSEIEKMVKDAELHKEEDAKKKELIELKNQADSLAYQTKKTLDENKDKLDSNVVSEIESAVKELEDSAKSESTTKEELESKIKNLNDKAQVLAQAMQSNAQNSGNTQSAKKGKDDDVIDAEVE